MRTSDRSKELVGELEANAGSMSERTPDDHRSSADADVREADGPEVVHHSKGQQLKSARTTNRSTANTDPDGSPKEGRLSKLEARIGQFFQQLFRRNSQTTATMSLSRPKLSTPKVHGKRSRPFRWIPGLVSFGLLLGLAGFLFYKFEQVTSDARQTLIFLALAGLLGIFLTLKGWADAFFGGAGSWARVSRLGKDVRMASIAWGAMSVFFSVVFITDGRIVSGDLRNANALLEMSESSIDNSTELLERLQEDEVLVVSNDNEIGILLDPWERSQSFWNELSSAVETDGIELVHAEQTAALAKIHGELLELNAYRVDLEELQSAIENERERLGSLEELTQLFEVDTTFFESNTMWLIAISALSSAGFYVYWRKNQEPELEYFIRVQNYLDYEKAYGEVSRRAGSGEPQDAKMLELIGLCLGSDAEEDKWVEPAQIEYLWDKRQPSILSDPTADLPRKRLSAAAGNGPSSGAGTVADLFQPLAVLGGLTLPTIAAFLSNL